MNKHVGKLMFLILFCMCSCSQKLPKDASLLTYGGKRSSWNCKHFPITIVIHAGIPRHQRLSVIKAANFINKSIGRNIFIYKKSFNFKGIRHPKNVINGYVAVIPIKKIKGAIANAWLNLNKNGKINSALIQLTLKINNPFKTAIHELMHVLGFAHDRDRRSFMYPKALKAKQLITNKDLKLMKHLYKTC